MVLLNMKLDLGDFDNNWFQVSYSSGEDVSDLFRQINHTHYSWVVVNSIQTYWIYNNKIGMFAIVK